MSETNTLHSLLAGPLRPLLGKAISEISLDFPVGKVGRERDIDGRYWAKMARIGPPKLVVRFDK